MAKFFKTRKAEEVKKFLESRGYALVGSNGDDEIWALDDCQYTVKLPSRNEEIPRGTMGSIRRMIRNCGLSDKEMLSWWKENGYGE